MLIEATNIKKAIGEKVLFEIPKWIIYPGERIGIVGLNGSGKTTLLTILAGKEEADTGSVVINSPIGFIEQLPENQETTSLSGGEETKQRIQEAFQMETGLLFADEPTSHLDQDGRAYLEKRLKQFAGGALIVSHDRAFLNAVCTKIVELENGVVHFYSGNYDAYREQKEIEKMTAESEYITYEKEKRRLKKVAEATEKRAAKVKKAPSRMGNSEARLHKMGDQRAKKKLGENVKNVEQRLQHLDVKTKPIELAPIKIKLDKGREIHQKIVLSGSKVSKGFGTKQLLENAEFTLYNHSRTALIGANGVGKTTLIKMIIEQDKHIQQAKNVEIGYFSQKLDGLDESQSILENVMKESIHEEDFVRMLLARLLFKGQDVYKKVAVISGGEKNKVSMAKLLVSSANVLIFDEPTNYLDLASIEAVESALKSYEGTVLFVSHDPQFVENIATHYWQISDKKIKMWEPETLEVSPELVQDAGETLLTSEEKMLIENRLSALLGRISMPSKKDNVLELEKEYQELTQKLKE